MKQEALVGIGDVPAAGDHSSGVHGAVGTVWWLTAAESAVHFCVVELFPWSSPAMDQGNVPKPHG